MKTYQVTGEYQDNGERFTCFAVTDHPGEVAGAVQTWVARHGLGARERARSVRIVGMLEVPYACYLHLHPNGTSIFQVGAVARQYHPEDDIARLMGHLQRVGDAEQAGCDLEVFELAPKRTLVF